MHAQQLPSFYFVTFLVTCNVHENTEMKTKCCRCNFEVISRKIDTEICYSACLKGVSRKNDHGRKSGELTFRPGEYTLFLLDISTPQHACQCHRLGMACGGFRILIFQTMGVEMSRGRTHGGQKVRALVKVIPIHRFPRQKLMLKEVSHDS